MEEDKDVSRRYRELPHEEPPPSLDARIRAQARSAVETHAAPLVPPTGRSRWYFPVAAAAVIMLAVAVTWQIDREQPEMLLKEQDVSPEAAKQSSIEPQPKIEEAKPQKKVQPPERRSAEKPRDQVAPQASTDERSRDQFSRDNRERQERPSGPPAASPPAESAAPPSLANAQQGKLRADLQARQAAPAARAESSSAYDVAGAISATQGMAISNPAAMRDYWLDQIAELRKQGRDDEADKALAEFRKRYPDYKIPPETLKKVERAK